MSAFYCPGRLFLFLRARLTNLSWLLLLLTWISLNLSFMDLHRLRFCLLLFWLLCADLLMEQFMNSYSITAFIPVKSFSDIYYLNISSSIFRFDVKLYYLGVGMLNYYFIFFSPLLLSFLSLLTCFIVLPMLKRAIRYLWECFSCSSFNLLLLSWCFNLTTFLDICVWSSCFCRSPLQVIPSIMILLLVVCISTSILSSSLYD